MFVLEKTAEDAVRSGASNYIDYIAQSKFAHAIDGLKSVHRRIIWTAGASHDEKKVGALASEVCSLYHPHGPVSVEKAIARMIQPFSVGYRFFEAIGNYGNYVDGPDSAASGRYIECKPSEFSIDLFFRGVNKESIPMTFSEHGKTLEPDYLIPRLPAALLYESFTIGSGASSRTVPYNFSDICDLVMMYVESKGDLDFTKCGRYFIPNFPYETRILNYNEIINSFEREDYTPDMKNEGAVTLQMDNAIFVKTVSFGNSFASAHEKLIELFKDKKEGKLFDWGVTDIHSSGGCQLPFKRNANIFLHANEILKKIKFSGNVVQKPTYLGIDKHFHTYTPPELFSIWYGARRQSIIVGFRQEQRNLTNERFQINAQILVKEKPEILDFIKNVNTENLTELLIEKFNLRRVEALSISNTPLVKLSNNSREKNEKRLVEIDERLSYIKEKQIDVDSIIYADAEYFKKKYRKKFKRNTEVDPFDAYMKFKNGGILQVKGEEIEETLKSNKLTTEEIHMLYRPLSSVKKQSGVTPPRYKKVIAFKGNTQLKTYGEVPSQLLYADYLCGISKENYTAKIEGGRVSYARGIQAPVKTKKIQTFNIAKRHLIVLKDGSVKNDDLEGKNVTKSVGVGAFSDIIYFLPKNYGRLCVVSMNRKEKNVLYFNLVDPNLKSFVTVLPNKKHVFLGFIPLSAQYGYFNLDIASVERTTAKFFKIEDPKELFKESVNPFRCSLIEKKTIRGRKLKKDMGGLITIL